MRTDQTAGTFMLLLRGGVLRRNMTPTEHGQVIEKYLAWIESLRRSGHYEASEPLEEDGKVLSGKRGSTVTDGLFAESKEIVGGFFLITACDLDEASEIAKGCPIFDNEGTVEGLHWLPTICGRHANLRMFLQNNLFLQRG